jgi:hypothetical protein
MQRPVPETAKSHLSKAGQAATNILARSIQKGESHMTIYVSVNFELVDNFRRDFLAFGSVGEQQATDRFTVNVNRYFV